MHAGSAVHAFRPAPSFSSLHACLQALEQFGIPFVCYGRNGSRALVSAEIQEELESEGGPDISERCDALAREELLRIAPRRDIAALSCVRLSPTPVAGNELAVYLTGGDREGIAAVVVLRARRGALSDATAQLGLSRREHQVAHLIALGLSTKVVAARLGISIHTVRHHIERVYAKMGLHTRAEIARALVQSNVSPEATSLSEDEHRSPCDAASVSFSVLH